MKRIMLTVAVLAFVLMLAGCASTGGTSDGGVQYKKPDAYNLKFVGFDTGIDDPAGDRRAYYKIFIDKAEEGRTTTGLESQEKTCEIMLQPNRHLITVEKWVLDQKSGRYVKLNNIEQPKPNFIYFELPEDRIVVIEMRSRKDGTSDFTIEHERR